MLKTYNLTSSTCLSWTRLGSDRPAAGKSRREYARRQLAEQPAKPRCTRCRRKQFHGRSSQIPD